MSSENNNIETQVVEIKNTDLNNISNGQNNIHNNNKNLSQQNNNNSIDNSQQQELDNLSETSIAIDPVYEEPQTHVQRKGIVEVLFGQCLKMDYGLNNREVRAFIDLKISCNKKFDQNRNSHNKLVVNLWYQWKNEDLNIKDINNEEWKVFGFQQKNPRTDFRGGGITGLKHLIYFFEQNRDLVLNQMINEKNDFIFAVTSINVSFFLMKYFQLLNFLEYKKDKEVMCSRKAFKTFNKFLSEDPIFLYNIHDLVLKEIFKQWMDLKKSNPKVTILDFGQAQQKTESKVRRLFGNQDYRNFDEFKSQFLQSI